MNRVGTRVIKEKQRELGALEGKEGCSHCLVSPRSPCHKEGQGLEILPGALTMGTLGTGGAQGQVRSRRESREAEGPRQKGLTGSFPVRKGLLPPCLFILSPPSAASAPPTLAASIPFGIGHPLRTG